MTDAQTKPEIVNSERMGQGRNGSKRKAMSNFDKGKSSKDELRDPFKIYSDQTTTPASEKKPVDTN